MEEGGREMNTQELVTMIEPAVEYGEEMGLNAGWIEYGTPVRAGSHATLASMYYALEKAAEDGDQDAIRIRTSLARILDLNKEVRS